MVEVDFFVVDLFLCFLCGHGWCLGVISVVFITL